MQTNKYIFLSYVRNDKNMVEKICSFLDHHEVPYWIDRKDILPGQDWKLSIHSAIENGSLFISLFSRNYLERMVTYMNEELTVAIECLRKRPQNSSWFIPARLDNCDIPKISIGAGKFISDIQSLDFFEDFEAAEFRLLDVIKANKISYNPEKLKTKERNELELKYLSLKALIDSGEGSYFHNRDMGHPVYIAGALGKGTEPWEYADGPDKNDLYRQIKEVSAKLKNTIFNVDQYIWWYDFNSWQSFCKYVVNKYRKLHGYKEL